MAPRVSEDDSALNVLKPQRLHSPQALALGIELVSLEPQVVLKIPYREDLIGDPETGVIAGGVVTTLLDTTCGWATAVALTELTTIATLDLRIDYMRPAEPGKAIFATADCYKLTRSVAFLRALAYDDDPSDPVAAAQAAFMLDSNAGRRPGANLAPAPKRAKPR
jgi:uncharacterized protein (TIGR00369 family)